MTAATYIAGLTREFRWVVAIVGLISLSALGFAALSGSADAVGMGIGILVGGSCAALLFARVKLVVSEHGLRVSTLWVFRRRIPLSDIVDVSVGPPTGLAEGAGFRLLGDGRVGYLVGGDCVEVATRRRAVLISVPSAAEAQEVVDRLSTRGANDQETPWR